MRFHRQLLWFTILCCGMAGLSVLPQRGLAQYESRTAEIEAAREKKAQELKPAEPNKIEQRLLWIQNSKILERISAGIYGVRVKIGGMPTGEGLAVGPEYARADLFGGNMLARVSAQISTGGSTKFEGGFDLPRLFGGSQFAELNVLRQNYRAINYYGPGPDSEKTGRTNFRYEDVALDALYGVKLGRYLRAGPTFGALWVNVGPGQNERYASADATYTPVQAIGIDRQTSFWRGGVFAQFDYRDYPPGARSGGNYQVEWDSYQDLDLKLHDFRQLNAEAQQFVPFFNKRRVIALRAKTTLTWTRDGQTLPFYMQPVLGGSEDLRGYRPYRFYGDNSMLMNAEYRWETFTGLDMAIFADAGKVFMDKSELNFRDLESSVGFGFRFNVRNATFLRIDTGFSHEGWQVWVKFNPVFLKRPIGRSSPEYIFSGGQ